ncbi:ketopantoate reductase family protein [Halovenus marina]|uniref:ketopantoate reductase family protein n=1 Tax=Halovenus marina TaxID=3396621 RepID=UPI003F544B4D
MDICVFGAGSLGSLLGGLLAREHDVTLVGRDPHVAAIERDGLRVTGAFDLKRAPEAATEPRSADLAVVAVKAYDTPEAARALSTFEYDAVLSVQNGMGNEATLAAGLSCPVLAGTCTYGARLSNPGVVECTGVGTVTLGPRVGGDSAVATRVGQAFEQAGIDTVVADDMPRRLWEKLAVNAAINPTTALARVENRATREAPLRETATAVAHETARVAGQQGIDLDPTETADRVFAVADATAENTSSMLQDVQAERRTEIDAINGYVVEQADRLVPVTETLTRLVRGWERARGLRE